MKGYPEHSSQSSGKDGVEDGLNGRLLDNAKPSKSLRETLEMTIVVHKSDGSFAHEDDSDTNHHAGRVQTDKSPKVRTGHLERFEKAVGNCWAAHRRLLTRLIKSLTLLAYMVYFIYCLNYRFGDEGSIVLVAGTCVLLLVIACRLFSGRCGCSARLASSLSCSPRWRRNIRYGLYVVSLVALGAYLGFEVFIHHPQNAQSLLGIVGILLVCFVLSEKPSKVNWHPVFWGFVIQFCFATITLQTETGYRAFKWLGDMVQRLLRFSQIGSAFVIGQNYRSMGLAFAFGGVMIFFGSLMGLLTHWGIIQFIVIKGGRFLSYAMNTGPVESVIAIANIFIGLSQAPLLVRPYLPTMSRSELGALMTCGYASVSGDTMALFIASGAPANHLLTAAIISAPAALAVAKLLMPGTEPVDLVTQASISAAGIGGSESQNALSAAADGARIALKLAVSAMTNMLAFVSLLGLIDAILQWFGDRAGVQGLTFDSICGYVLYPLAFAMGAPPEDCARVGSLIGIKLFATPVIGYAELGKIINNRAVLEDYIRSSNGTWHWEGTDVILDSTNTTLVHGFMSERAEVITTYAMCGFSAFTAIGISLGSLTSLCPSRKSDVISLVAPAFLGGNVASFATGAVAGLLYSSH